MTAENVKCRETEQVAYVRSSRLPTKGTIYYMTSAEQAEKFKAEPEKYLPPTVDGASTAIQEVIAALSGLTISAVNV